MRRAIGGSAKMLHLSVNDLEDINVEYSLATFIDDQERENNPANISVLEQRKMTDLVNTAMNNNLYLVLALARTLTNQAGVLAGVTGAWSAAASGVSTNAPPNETHIPCTYIPHTYPLV